MRVVLAVALTVASAPAVAQRDVPREWQLRLAAETYRAANTDAALQMLAADRTDTQRRTAKVVVDSHRIRIGTIQPPEDTSPHWTLALLRAAGAVHMEQALALYKRGGRNLSDVVLLQIEIGELLLDEVATLEGRPSDAARWEWTIGQQAMSDGAFHTAPRRRPPGIVPPCTRPSTAWGPLAQRR